MTTDNFTEAARAEAERVARENTPLEYGSIWDAFVDAYAAGLQARTHLAAQEPTDAEVEAAAGAVYRNPEGWAAMLTAYRERVAEVGPIPTHMIAHRLELAREGLRAARAVRRDEETP